MFEFETKQLLKLKVVDDYDSQTAEKTPTNSMNETEKFDPMRNLIKETRY